MDDVTSSPFPPIPDLPEVSLFTQYGRPCRFRAMKRRIWFGMESPWWRRATATAAAHLTFAQQERPQGAPAVVWPQPPIRPPDPHVALRLTVPPRVEADVPMREVERILAGGFWRVDGPRVGDADSGVEGARDASGEVEDGLSMYMRSKMRQEEREAEEALEVRVCIRTRRFVSQVLTLRLTLSLPSPIPL